MDDVKKQVIERLKQANNVLVTVRTNPTVDLLSSCIGLALALDKLDKHATAVFSGQVPSTIEFLKPEETIEPTPDSLRDFIIALDKSKADKLRYKVEDDVVRIFITPYKTSITEKDLEFSQGDFNVDAIVALGAHEQQELDQAVTTHGRILHDATTISINNTPNGSLGAVNWQDIGASSIAEMVTQLVKDLGGNVLDPQIATALLTGIVAETGRFSNEKTTPRTMSLAGDLMAAGANQQLVATELQVGPGQSAPSISAPAPAATTPTEDNGTLEIEHLEPPVAAAATDETEKPKITPGHEMLPMPGPRITNVHGSPLGNNPFTEAYGDEETLPAERSYLVEEPVLPGNTPKSSVHAAEPSRLNPLDVSPAESQSPLISRDMPAAPPAAPSAPAGVAMPPLSYQPQAAAQPIVPPMSPLPPTPPLSTTPASGPQPAGQTLEEIEASVHSPHLAASQPVSEPSAAEQHGDLSAARSQVLEALRQGPQPLEPLTSLNASPLGGELHPHTDAGIVTPPLSSTSSVNVEVDAEGNLKPVQPAAPMPAAAQQPMGPGASRPAAGSIPLPSVMPPFGASPSPTGEQYGGSPDAPPPVPPPMTPPMFPGQ